MPTFYLVRHGQNLDNLNGILNGHRDEPLTDLGLRQAEDLADEIQAEGLTFDIVYASRLQRAYNTGLAITRRLGIPDPTVLDGLIERNFGTLTGRPVGCIEEVCGAEIIKTDTITYFLSPEGAETFPDLLVRAQAVISQLKAKHPDGSVLLVTHGDIGKMIYCAYYNLEWRDVLTGFHFGNSEVLKLAPGLRPEEAHMFKRLQHNH